MVDLVRWVRRSTPSLLLLCMGCPGSGADGPRPPPRHERAGVRYRVAGRLASTVLVLDAHGRPIEWVAFPPQGPVDPRSPDDVPIFFAGVEPEPWSLGVQLGVRRLLPALGGFGGPDPRGLVELSDDRAEDPLAHPYLHADGDPIDRLDEDGRNAVLWAAATGAVAFGTHEVLSALAHGQRPDPRRVATAAAAGAAVGGFAALEGATLPAQVAMGFLVGSTKVVVDGIVHRHEAPLPGLRQIVGGGVLMASKPVIGALDLAQAGRAAIEVATGLVADRLGATQRSGCGGRPPPCP